MSDDGVSHDEAYQNTVPFRMFKHSGEVRRTSSTGGAKGDKIFRFDQIPAGPMKELAARYGLGSTKYEQKNGLDNWRNGYPFSLSMAALERHYYAFKAGEDNDDSIYREAGLVDGDEDSLYDEDGNLRPGVSHLSAVVWHCFFLMHHLEAHPELDDRPSTVERRNAAGLAATEAAPEYYPPFDLPRTFLTNKFRTLDGPLPAGTEVLVRRPKFDHNDLSDDSFFLAEVGESRMTPNGWQYYFFDSTYLRDRWLWREDLFVQA